MAMVKYVDRHSGLLFSSDDLGQVLANTNAAVVAEVDRLDQERMLNTAPADLARYLVERYSIEAPVLRRDAWSATEAEASVDVRYDPNRWIQDKSRPALVAGQRIEIEVPIDGNIDLMYARPSTFTSSPPRAQIRGQSLVLVFEVPSDAGERDIKKEADRVLADIETYLQWVQSAVNAFNAALPGVAESAISARRERVLKNKGRVAALGIPLKTRDGAPRTYVVPGVRRKIVPALPAATSAPYMPEPVIDMQNYDHILSVVQNMAEVMERSPSSFRSMGEEDLRQHFLVQLNGQFEGAATGETFNFNGKTDILLREKGRNVFIAECKFWKGPKHYRETIDQLLSYAAWRDSKTAILVFCRDTALSTVLGGIKKETEAHTNFKRAVDWQHETGFRYVMRNTDDPNRELILTVMAFHVPGDGSV